MYQKGFAPIVIIVIAILVISAGIGGFLMLREKKAPPSQEVAPSPIPPSTEEVKSKAPALESPPLPSAASKPSSEGTIKTTTEKIGNGKSEKSPLSIEWQQLTSPPGGGYWTITIAPSNPEIILVASRDFNVVKTTNGGKTWKILGEKLFGAHIFSNIAVHPFDPNTIFLSNGVIYYTNDGGITWSASHIKTGTGDEAVEAIAYNTKNPDIMYAGNRNEFFISSDRGKNWNLAGTVEGGIIRNIVEGAGGEIYAMTNDFGVSKSTDNGKTWIRKNKGIGAFDYIYGSSNNRYLVYDKLSSKLYLATEKGLFISSDGEQWQKNGPFQDENLPITVAAAGSTVFVTTESGRLYKSNDGGESWEVVYTINHVESAHGFNYAVSIHNSQPHIVYVVADREILKSIDGGKSWQEMSKEIYDDALFVMNYAKDTETLWVGAYWTRGLFTTKDDGRNWNFIKNWRHTPPQDHYPMNLEVSPLNGNEVYVSGSSGVKKTIDNGKTWIVLGGEESFVSDKHIHGMSVVYNNPSIIYAGTAPGWNQKGQISQVFKSTDRGETWKKLTGFPSREENNVYAFAIKDSTIYVGLNQHESDIKVDHDNSLGLWKSQDAGETWQDISSNLPNKNVFSVAVHPQNQEIVYAGLGHGSEGEHDHMGAQGLFRSGNGGKSWQRIAGLPALQPSKIRFHPKNPEIILVSFGEHICGACTSGENDSDERNYPKGAGVWGSIDGGEKWYNLIPDGVFTKRQLAVMDLVFKDEDTLYAVTDDGIFKGEIKK